MTVSNPLRFAVLINTYTYSLTTDLKKSFKDAIHTAAGNCPSVEVDFYDPIEAQEYPDPAKYDLIVLTGGTENMTGDVSTHKPWVKKIMGTCWGHQIICVAFGGVVGTMKKAELGITTVTLTQKGKSFLKFPTDELHIHEFHKRKVLTPAPGFVPLAEDGQSFINSSNTIISFQGHAELNAELAKAMLNIAPSYMCVEGEQKETVYKTIGYEHDGPRIWNRVIQWIREE